MRIDGHELKELRDLAEQAATVASAYQAGIFRGLGEGPTTPDELARRIGLAPRAVGILLPVLAEMDLLERRGERFALTPGARRALADPEGEQFEGGGLPLWLLNLRAFTRLPEVLASGEPLEKDDEDLDDEEALARFMAGMAAAPRSRVERIVDACLDRVRRPRRVLDLGGGPGHMSRAFVERGLEVTLFDRPETVTFVAGEYGLSRVEGLELVGGDFMEDALPGGPFDVVLLSNVVHIYPPEENRELLRRVGRITRPGGVGAIADFVRGRSDRAAYFALIMLLRTEGGDTYSEEQLAGWLEAGGFRDPETVDVDDQRQLVTGVRGDD